MKVGIHVSIAGSIDRAVDNAVSLGCTAFQIFSRNPRGWAAKPFSKNDISNFKQKASSSNIDGHSITVMMPFLPNLSSPDDDPHKRSVESLILEIKRSSQLGIPYLVTRLGGHKGAGEKLGIERSVNALTKAAHDTPDDVMILLQNSFGYQNSVGSSLEQLGEIFSQLRPANRFGFCLDTAHAFTSGYDFRTGNKVQDFMQKFDGTLGLENLKMIHLNDSKTELGSGVDRHEHIGMGKIGEDGLSFVLKMAKSKEIPVILETPIDDRRDDLGNLKKARELAVQ